MCNTVTDAKFFERTWEYSPLFFVPMYEPRGRKVRIRRKFREHPSAKPWMRMSFRNKATRFNPWVYNAKPYVWKPAHKR